MLRIRLEIRSLLVPLTFFLAVSLASVGHAQTANKRLILKDGTYQIATQYKVVGDRVRYFSAERAEWEEIPAALVDWAATEKWARDHVPGAVPGAVPGPVPSPGASPANPEAAAIDKEEQQERAEQNARTPEVSPRLRLPDEQGVWALDTFRDQPELVALVQNTGNVNQQTGHNVLRGMLNPMGGMKKPIELPGAYSKVRLHISQPVIYVSLSTEDAAPAEPEPGSVTVDTHGADAAKQKDSYSSPASQYAIVRVFDNLRRDYRVVSAVKIGMTGTPSQTEDIIPTTAQILPGKRWMKLTPRAPLTIGDYALMEILAPGQVNVSVWDFRIDPQAADNKDAIIPLERSSR